MRSTLIGLAASKGCLPTTWPQLCAGPYKDYIKCLSTDFGSTWTCTTMIGVGAARPKLHKLPSGALLLSGGRQRNRNTSDISIWLNAAGDGDVWDRYSISYWHNKQAPKGLLTYPPNINSTVQVCGGCGWTSTYTSILQIFGDVDTVAAADLTTGGSAAADASTEQPNAVVLVYDRCDTELCDQGQDVFSMKVTLV